jgi:hypothetical protein
MFMAFAAILLVASPLAKSDAAEEADDDHLTPDIMGMPVDSGALWYRYLEGGELAKKKGDEDLARRYYMGSLASIERDPNPQKGDPFFLPRVSKLENSIINLYGSALSKEMDGDDKVKLATEQCNAYERMAKLNTRFVDPGNPFITKAQERFEKVKSDLEKIKAEVASQKQTSDTK